MRTDDDDAPEYPQFLPTTDEIGELFREEVAAAGGTVTDRCEVAGRLFLRAVLPGAEDVRPGDAVQGGVALRAAGAGPEVLVHPYTFLQVCSNGAIAAHAVGTRRVERVACADDLVVVAPAYEVAAATAALREAVRACAAPEALATAVGEMRSMAEVEADLALHLLPILSQLPGHMAAHLARQILGRFAAEPDRSLFGLHSAVTALARDTADAELRWRLEELGGAMGARLRPVAPRVVVPGAAEAWRG